MPPPQGAILAWGSAFPARSTTPMPNAIVYLQVWRSTGNSQVASARADAAGQWWYDLQRLRTGDGQTFFLPQPNETLSLTTDGGPLGQGRMTTQVPSDNSISVVNGLFELQVQSAVYLPVLLSP